jgi:hypothetical protein
VKERLFAKLCSNSAFATLRGGSYFLRAPCGTLSAFARFYVGISCLKGNFKMDERDQELLDKQLRYLGSPPRNDGVMILTIIAIFIAGVTVGGALFSHEDDSMQIASNDATAIHSPNGAQLIVTP